MITNDHRWFTTPEEEIILIQVIKKILFQGQIKKRVFEYILKNMHSFKIKK
jgi:hypothetical protein